MAYTLYLTEKIQNFLLESQLMIGMPNPTNPLFIRPMSTTIAIGLQSI